MRVWAKEFSHKGKTRLNYSTSIGKKHDNDEYYDNVYYDVLFKQANKPFLPDNSFEIYIKKGFLTVTTYNDGSIHPAVMVMEYELKDDITADDIPF